MAFRQIAGAHSLNSKDRAFSLYRRIGTTADAGISRSGMRSSFLNAGAGMELRKSR